MTVLHRQELSTKFQSSIDDIKKQIDADRAASTAEAEKCVLALLAVVGCWLLCERRAASTSSCHCRPVSICSALFCV